MQAVDMGPKQMLKKEFNRKMQQFQKKKPKSKREALQQYVKAIIKSWQEITFQNIHAAFRKTGHIACKSQQGIRNAMVRKVKGLRRFR